jgi:hypothetical protein
MGGMMKAGRLIAYIAAAILIFFGVLFIWATFSPQGTPGWLVIGAISVGAGFVLIWFAGRMGREDSVEIIQKIDLSGDMNLESLRCRNCGGALSSKDISMVEGAPFVKCPYCGTTYQLTEEPKW